MIRGVDYHEDLGPWNNVESFSLAVVVAGLVRATLKVSNAHMDCMTRSIEALILVPNAIGLFFL